MKSCGVSFHRISYPALLLGFFVSLFAVWFNEYIVPWANSAYARVLNYEIKGNTAPQSQEHIIIKDIQNGQIVRLIYARRYDAATEIMQGVTMQMFEGGKASHVEDAEYAKDKWVMYQGIIYDIPKDSNKDAQHKMTFDQQVLPVKDSPAAILRDQKKPEEMTIKELREQIKILSDRFVNTKKVETELYQRFTIPFASFIFALVGIPLGLQPQRSSSSRGFAVSIIIIFIYYVFMTMGAAIAQSGALPAALAVWLPNIVGLIAGLFLMREAAR